MLFNIHINVGCFSLFYRWYHLPAEHFALLLAGEGDLARVTAPRLSFSLFEKQSAWYHIQSAFLSLPAIIK